MTGEYRGEDFTGCLTLGNPDFINGSGRSTVFYILGINCFTKSNPTGSIVHQFMVLSGTGNIGEHFPIRKKVDDSSQKYTKKLLWKL